MDDGFVESSHTRHGAGGLEVVWRFERGSIGFVANFAVPEFTPHIPAGAEIIWTSPGLADVVSPILPAWSGVIFTTAIP
jgi:hypothetical protein